MAIFISKRAFISPHEMKNTLSSSLSYLDITNVFLFEIHTIGLWQTTVDKKSNNSSSSFVKINKKKNDTMLSLDSERSRFQHNFFFFSKNRWKGEKNLGAIKVGTVKLFITTDFLLFFPGAFTESELEIYRILEF